MRGHSPAHSTQALPHSSAYETCLLDHLLQTSMTVRGSQQNNLKFFLFSPPPAVQGSLSGARPEPFPSGLSLSDSTSAILHSWHLSFWDTGVSLRCLNLTENDHTEPRCTFLIPQGRFGSGVGKRHHEDSGALLLLCGLCSQSSSSCSNRALLSRPALMAGLWGSRADGITPPRKPHFLKKSSFFILCLSAWPARHP